MDFLANASSAEPAEADKHRVLLVSLQNLRPQAWNGVSFEFVNVVAQMENATLAAPGERAPLRGMDNPLGRDLTRLAQRAKVATRELAGLAGGASGAGVEVEGTFDLCFFVCQFPREIGEIDAVRDWRAKSKRACIFILETWPQAVETFRADYRLLDRFDHVFVFNPGAIAGIRRHTSTPVTFLPTGSDTLMLPQSRFEVARCIDYLCIGRRKGRMHDALLDYCDRLDQFYVFDVWKDMLVRDWPAQRRHNAELAARARHFIVWAPVRPGAAAGESGQGALSNRYFEGASAGAVMLGSRPEGGEFERLFDWPDAVIELPHDPRELGPFLDELNAQPERLARIGERNRLAALERHDWAHRWAEILGTLGLEAGAGVRARMQELHRRALAEARPAGSHVPLRRVPASLG